MGTVPWVKTFALHTLSLHWPRRLELGSVAPGRTKSTAHGKALNLAN
jgi:hypothetical protein